MSLRIGVLLSAGRHPESMRARPSRNDAQALSLALRIPASDVHAVHAGAAPDDVLRGYLGLGLPLLTRLETTHPANPVPALVPWLSGRNLDLIFAGRMTETGRSSGMVPYLVADALGWPIIPDVIAFSLTAAGAEIVQWRPKGTRQIYRVALPFLATIHSAASPPLALAYRRMKSGIILTEPARPGVGTHLQGVPVTRRRPPTRLHAPSVSTTRTNRRVVHSPDPADAVQEILRELDATGLLPGDGSHREES